MLVIGELINGMFARVGRAIEEKDAAAVRRIASEQAICGAGALDINCGPGSLSPADDMKWLVETVAAAVDKLLVLDSGKEEVLEAGLQAAGRPCLLNSATAEPNKLKRLLNLAARYKSGLIVLTVGSSGMPQGCRQRIESAAQIVEICVETGFPLDNIYLDPVLMPVSVAQAQVGAALETIREFKVISPELKSVVGLSNVSQSAPHRRLLNRVFLSMAAAYGLDAAILDPTDRELMKSLAAADILLNRNIYCESFLKECGGAKDDRG